MRRLGVRALVGAVLVIAGAAAPAQARVPAGWLGVSLNDFALSPKVDLDREAGVMSRAGIQSVRLPVFWDRVEPARGVFRLAELDRAVGAAATQNLNALVVVNGATPRWESPRKRVGAAPKHNSDYLALLTELMDRYGPGGTYWAAHPEVPNRPVRAWQIWNEPELPGSWWPQPFAKRYVKLLRESYAAVKRRDPGAIVVTAGLTNFSWKDLESMYKAGARGSFDMVAVHPYTFLVRNVFRIADKVRAVMRRHGDGAKPMVISELSWFSSRRYLGPYELFSVSEADQAKRLSQAIRGLAARRKRDRIAGVYWYTWVSPKRGSQSVFDYAGLRRLGTHGPVDKPALGAMRKVARALER